MPDAQRAEIAKLEALHADHPEGRIFTHLAEAYRKAGELGRAKEVLAQGIERHPDYSSAHVVLARVLVDEGETGEAEAEFRRVLELDSQNLVALRALGGLARSDGRTEDALNWYRRLLDVEPSDEEVREIIEEMETGSPGMGPDLARDEPWAAGEVEKEAEPFTEVAWSPHEEVGGAPAPDTPATKGGPAEFGLEAGDVEASDAQEGFAQEGGAEEGFAEEGVGEEGFAEGGFAEEGFAEEGFAEGGFAEEGGVEEGRAEASGAEYGGAQEVGGGEEWPGAAEGSSDEDGFAPLPGPGEPGMLTETIAQVYARQGLYGRAAEVYRQLVRSRPDDTGLRARMEEMEALAGGLQEPGESEPEGAMDSDSGWVFGSDPGSETEPPQEPQPEPAPEPVFEIESEEPTVDVEPLPGLETSEPPPPPDVAPMAGLEADEVDPETGLRTEEPSWEPWSDGSSAADEAGAAEEPEAEAVESVWTGAGGASEAEETPYAWAHGEGEGEEDAEEGASEPIGSYFRSLLGWSDVSASPSPAGGEADEAAGEPGGATDSETPDDDDLDTFRSWLESLKQ